MDLNTALDTVIKRFSSNNRIVIASGNSFEVAGGFFIDVKTAGNVSYETWGGQIATEAMGVGYHPTKLRRILDTTAVDITVIF